MAFEQFKYVIIGGGVAAGYAAQTIAQHGENASSQLCILSADSQLPYERPSLSKQFLAGDEIMSDILINDPDFYTDYGIDIRLRTVVGRVDCREKLLYAGNDTIGFESLLIATGARPKDLSTPGFDLAGVHTLRLVSDACQIRKNADNARHAVVIGGSFIGMEVSSVLQRLGIQTTMVFPNDRVWQSFFTPEISRFFEEYYRARGVTFVKEARVDRFLGDDDHVERVMLDSGQELAADLVVAGVGVTPNIELFRNTPLHTDDGIVVNRFLETIVPGIFAAGDIANFNDPVTGQLRRIEHWDNAKTQGQHAACGMLGIRQEYRHVPYFFSDVFDLSYEFWGDTSGAESVVYRGSSEENSLSAWWLDADNRLEAAFVLNRPEEEAEMAPAWIRNRTTLDPDLLRNAESLRGAEK